MGLAWRRRFRLGSDAITVRNLIIEDSLHCKLLYHKWQHWTDVGQLPNKSRGERLGLVISSLPFTAMSASDALTAVKTLYDVASKVKHISSVNIFSFSQKKRIDQGYRQQEWTPSSFAKDRAYRGNTRWEQESWHYPFGRIQRCAVRDLWVWFPILQKCLLNFVLTMSLIVSLLALRGLLSDCWSVTWAIVHGMLAKYHQSSED